MLHLTIGVIAFVAFIYIKAEETAEAKAQKECDETDWNEYYAHI